MHKRTLGWTCDGVQATTTCLPITFAALSLVVCTCDMLALSRMSRAGRHGPIHTRSAMQKSPSDYHCTFLKPKRGILQQLLWTLWVSTQELLVLQNSKAIKIQFKKSFFHQSTAAQLARGWSNKGKATLGSLHHAHTLCQPINPPAIITSEYDFYTWNNRRTNTAETAARAMYKGLLRL